ncbi:biliverdin-producing heme oxygenase [Brevundimonas sp.]
MADSTATAVSPRFALRAATSEAHERLDARFSTFDLADAGDYGRFLLAQAGAFFPVEQALDEAGVAEVIDDWPARRRSDALRADLAALGLPEPKWIVSPPLSSKADTLGALYVLEGSRLGGAMLVRTVPDGLPKSFLTPGNPADWRAFVTVLDQRLSSQADLDAAAATASAVFEAFAASASNALGNDDT